MLPLSVISHPAQNLPSFHTARESCSWSLAAAMVSSQEDTSIWTRARQLSFGKMMSKFLPGWHMGGKFDFRYNRKKKSWHRCTA